MAQGGRNARAEKFQSDADKMANKFDWFGANRERNQEGAAELYVKAAAQWKISKEFGNAGQCYENAAKCNMAADNQIEANSNWREAGKAYRHVDSQQAINAYKNAIQHYLDSDRFNQAARLTEEIADMLAEDEHLEEAIAQYEECADLYETDNDQTAANKRLLKVAHMSAKLRKYGRAIELFEKIGNHNVDNQLLRWNVKGLLFKAFVCVLNDAAERDDPKVWEKLDSRLERYMSISDLFASSREAKLCRALAETVPAGDLDKYKEEVTKFNTIQKLEAWSVEQLLHLEHYIVEKRHEAPDLMGDNGPPGYDEAPGDSGPDLQSAAVVKNPFDEPKSDDNFQSAPDLL